MRFDQTKDQEVKRGPNQPNLNQQLEMVGCIDKDHPNPLSRVMT